MIWRCRAGRRLVEDEETRTAAQEHQSLPFFRVILG